MASIEKRILGNGKASFRVKIRLRGYPPQSATFERKTDAKKWAQQTEAAIREGRYFQTSESRKHTLSELIDRYLEYELPKLPKVEKVTGMNVTFVTTAQTDAEAKSLLALLGVPFRQ